MSTSAREQHSGRDLADDGARAEAGAGERFVHPHRRRHRDGMVVDSMADRFLVEHPEVVEEDRFSPRYRGVVARLMAPWAAYYRFRCHGLENVPEGGCLMVANHSVGAIAEIALIARAWHHRFPERPARGLAHRLAWQPPFSWFQLQKIGAVFAHPEVARRALERGQALLVFPGGDLEAMRPFADRYKVTLGGRTGFARLAREAGVPIVPVVICGAHATYLVLKGGRWLAKMTPLGRMFGLKGFPTTLGAASAVATLLVPPLWPMLGPVLAAAALPLPSKIEMEFLEPIAGREGETDAELAERVRVAMQAAMDRLAARRRTPWG